MTLKEESKYIIFFTIGIFILSFVIHFSLTYNIDFFWEDAMFFDDKNITLTQLSQYFFSNLLSFNEFYHVNYSQRLLYTLFIKISTFLFGIDIIMIRFVKVLLFSIIPTILFLFALKTSKDYLASMLISIYFILLPENLFLHLYVVEPLPYTTLFTVLACFIFFFYYYNKNYTNIITFISGFLIVLFSRIANLIKHQSRTNFLLFGLFLLFIDPKKLLKMKYWMLILILFALSFPILNILNLNDAIDISTHMEINDSTDIINKILLFFKTLPATFYPHTKFLIVPFILSIILHLLFIYTKAKCDFNTTDSIKQLVIFSSLWFILGAIILFIGRGLAFEQGNYFFRFYYTYILFPQTLLLFSYPQLINSYFNKKIIRYIIMFFIILAIFHNVGALNSARGGWGDWLLGWQTVRNYIESNNQSDILVVTSPHGAPFFFRSQDKDKVIINNDLTNKELLLNLSRQTNNVFVVPDRVELKETPPYLSLQTTLKVNDTSIYAKIKNLIGKKSKASFYVYIVNHSNLT